MTSTKCCDKINYCYYNCFVLFYCSFYFNAAVGIGPRNNPAICVYACTLQQAVKACRIVAAFLVCYFIAYVCRYAINAVIYFIAAFNVETV